PADARQFGIDVIQLVDDGVELRHPRFGAGIKTLLPRSIQRLIAEARQREREHVLDAARPDGDDRRFRDEPFRPASDAMGRSIAPEIITRLAGGKTEAV